MLQHADNNKILCKNKSVVEEIIASLKAKFRKMLPVSLGSEYNFLRIKISFMSNYKVLIYTRDYLFEAINVLGEKNLKLVTASSRSKIRLIGKDSLLLNNKKVKKFCRIVILLIHVS